eukprot:Skav229695  [mRNA]  locus=scaffold3722:200337:207677:- [translate_table: standard]
MHKLVEMPLSYSGQKVLRCVWVSAANARVWYVDTDVVFHPLIVQLFVDDAFCNSTESFRPFVINLTLKRIEEGAWDRLGRPGEESLNVKLETSSIKLVKDFRYKAGPLEGPTFCTWKWTFGGAVAMDFVEGSKEGVVPENAGDPLGYIPKSPWAMQPTRRPSEFRDTLLSDMDKWAKKSTPDSNLEQRWEADLPDGTEMAARKYDNDYSRFDQIQEEQDAPAEDSRDFYFDEKGVPKKLNEPKETKDALQPAMKKGFLENVKKALYPGGSGEAQAAADALKSRDLEQLAQLSDVESRWDPKEFFGGRN